MSEQLRIFAAFLIGMLTSLVFITLTVGGADSTYSKALDALAACEQSLPRDQHCVLTAVPETSHD